MNESERESTWKKAAGKDKNPRQHESARSKFVRNFNEDAAISKKGLGLDDKDRAVLKARQKRLSKQIDAQRARKEKPGYRDKENANERARCKIPEYQQKRYANNVRCAKAKTDSLQAERAVESKANCGRTTEFGLNDDSRENELERGAYNINNNPAGVHAEGDGTITNWIKDHGSKSIKEVLASRDWAAYFFVTKRKITPGKEIKCGETTDFMSNFIRDPLWRIDTVDNEEQCDLRLFRREEAKTVVHSYLLAKCISAYDATGLEGALQRYIEKMGMPHGLCLHKNAGAGSKLEYGSTEPEATWVALSLIRVKHPKFADVDPVDPSRSPPLTSCTVTSHDGKTDYNVSVRGDKKKISRYQVCYQRQSNDRGKTSSR